MIVMAMAQQKGGQLLTGLTQTADRRKTCAHEIADCLMTRIRNPDRGQLTRPMQELCWILGDGVDQAADISWFATSIPSRNFTPRTIFGN